MSTERQPIPGTVVREFESQAARDAFIEANFPTLKMTDVPGLYRIPRGGYLSVFCETIRFPATHVIKEPK